MTALVPVYLCLNSVWSALSKAPKSAPCDLGTGSPLAAASGSSYLNNKSAGMNYDTEFGEQALL